MFIYAYWDCTILSIVWKKYIFFLLYVYESFHMGDEKWDKYYNVSLQNCK